MTAAEPGQPTDTTRTDRRALLATCVAAAARAAEVIRAGEQRRGTLRWDAKGQSDFVSDVDRDAEHALAEVVRSRHADARLVGEEHSPILDSRDGLLFVADPLDGTTNFLHGFPWYAVSIAALVDGETQAGVVLNVANGDLFSATRGGGARRAGQPISVSPIEDPTRALIGTGFPFKHDSKDVDRYLAILPRIMMSCAGLRRPGSAALDLADVACGRFEAFFELMLAPWDVAAGTLLVREAGGIVTTIDGTPAPVDHTSIVAGNPSIHRWLLGHM